MMSHPGTEKFFESLKEAKEEKVQSSKVPYKYHQLNHGPFKAMTLEEQELWDEIREDRI
jgi:hypothetical protein